MPEQAPSNAVLTVLHTRTMGTISISSSARTAIMLTFPAEVIFSAVHHSIPPCEAISTTARTKLSARKPSYHRSHQHYCDDSDDPLYFDCRYGICLPAVTPKISSLSLGLAFAIEYLGTG